MILTRVYVILAMWAIMCIGVCMDLWAGVNSARARGEVINSGGFRRTIGKLGDYWRIQVMALIFDVIGSCIPWYEYPYASMIVTAAIVLISAAGNSMILKWSITLRTTTATSIEPM